MCSEAQEEPAAPAPRLSEVRAVRPMHDKPGMLTHMLTSQGLHHACALLAQLQDDPCSRCAWLCCCRCTGHVTCIQQPQRPPKPLGHGQGGEGASDAGPDAPLYKYCLQ